MNHKFKSLICVLVSLLLSLAAFPAFAAGNAGDAPFYTIIGKGYDNGTFQLNVYLQGCKAYSGQIDLNFDNTKLQLVSESNLREAFDTPSSVQIVQADNVNRMLSNSKGRVLFSWAAAGKQVDASSSRVYLGGIHFRPANGVDLKNLSLDSGSLCLNYSEDPNFIPMAIYANSEKQDEDGNNIEIDYIYNSENHPNCNLVFDYPGMTRPNSRLRELSFKLTEKSGTPIVGASLTCNGQTILSDSEGNVEFTLMPGAYSYMAQADGHEAKAGTAYLGGAGEQVDLVLRSNLELLQEEANHVWVWFSTGDTADSVSRRLNVTHAVPGGAQIEWLTSDTTVIAANGQVFRPEEAKDVVLTAVLSKDGLEVRKEFKLHVLARAKDEKPDGLDPIEDPNFDPDDPTTWDEWEKENEKNDDTDDEAESKGTYYDGEKYTQAPSVKNENKAFDDLGGVAWAKDAINMLAGAGIINGTAPGKFSPNDKVTRAQFITLLMRMLDKSETLAPPSGGAVAGTATERVLTPFTDVPSNSYYADLVNKAYEMGIVNGSNGKFLPDALISREDMVVMTMRAMKFEDKQDNLGEFKDSGKISGYALDLMKQAVGNGLIQGSDAKLRPLDSSTRAEAAMFLYRIYIR